MARSQAGPLEGLVCAVPSPTIHTETTNTLVALDSADHIAQLIAEFVTPGGKTDACTRGGE